MTNLSNLIKHWQTMAGEPSTAREYRLRLPLKDAARIAALAEMYVHRSETELISELLTAALDELESVMPYVPGSRVVSEDEEGNPVYEDIGPTPRFLELSRKYALMLEGEAAVAGGDAKPACPDVNGGREGKVVRIKNQVE